MYTVTGTAATKERVLLCMNRDDGQVNVIKPGRHFERVARYELGEQCYASPAISDGQVFVRGFRHLFCIGRRNVQDG